MLTVYGQPHSGRVFNFGANQEPGRMSRTTINSSSTSLTHVSRVQEGLSLHTRVDLHGFKQYRLRLDALMIPHATCRCPVEPSMQMASSEFARNIKPLLFDTLSIWPRALERLTLSPWQGAKDPQNGSEEIRLLSSLYIYRRISFFSHSFHLITSLQALFFFTILFGITVCFLK